MPILPASAVTRCGLPAASDSMTAGISAASEEFGPSSKMRLGPDSA